MCYNQGISIHYITSIHYILDQVVVVVHYIFQTIFVVVVNTQILRSITPLLLFLEKLMKMPFSYVLKFEKMRRSAVGNELRQLRHKFILIK